MLRYGLCTALVWLLAVGAVVVAAPAAKPEQVLQTFMNAWIRGDYKTAYALCSSSCRKEVSYPFFKQVLDAFNKNARHRGIKLVCHVNKAYPTESPKKVLVAFYFHETEEDDRYLLVQENGEWKVEWPYRPAPAIK